MLKSNVSKFRKFNYHSQLSILIEHAKKAIFQNFRKALNIILNYLL